MNTVLMTGFGFFFACALCCVMKMIFLLGLGEPNVLVAEGETYAGWWFTMFFLTMFAGTLAGMVIDTIGFVYRCVNKA